MKTYIYCILHSLLPIDWDPRVLVISEREIEILCPASMSHVRKRESSTHTCRHCVAAPFSRLSNPPTSTTRSPPLCTWNPPTTTPCLPSTSSRTGTSFFTRTNFSCPYFSSNSSTTSFAVTRLFSGTLAVEMIPLNQDATEGTNATFTFWLARSLRWNPASRSCM